MAVNKEKKSKRSNGEGSIYYDEKRERWCGAVTISKGKRKFVYGKKRKEVSNKLEEIKADLRLGTYCNKADLTVEEYLTQKITSEWRKNLINDNTYIRKKETLKAIQKHYIAKMRIQAVQPSDVDDYLFTITSYSDSYIRKQYGLLKNAFEDNIPEIIKISPMKGIKRPRSQKKQEKTRALTLDEQKQFLKILNENDDIKYKLQMLIMINTGLRMGEINALTVNDVNLKFNTVNITKTVTKNTRDIAIIGEQAKTEAGARMIPLSSKAKQLFGQALEEYVPNPKELLFHNNGKPISTSYVNMMFQHLRKKYQFVDESLPGKVTDHSLRHTYATRAIESGMSAVVLKDLLGHTDIKVTINTYADAFEQFKVVNISGVEEYLEKMLS